MKDMAQNNSLWRSKIKVANRRQPASGPSFGELSDYSYRNKREDQEGQQTYRFCYHISKEEVREALRDMETGKAMGSCRIPIKI